MISAVHCESLLQGLEGEDWFWNEACMRSLLLCWAVILLCLNLFFVLGILTRYNSNFWYLAFACLGWNSNFAYGLFGNFLIWWFFWYENMLVGMEMKFLFAFCFTAVTFFFFYCEPKITFLWFTVENQAHDWTLNSDFCFETNGYEALLLLLTWVNSDFARRWGFVLLWTKLDLWFVVKM